MRADLGETGSFCPPLSPSPRSVGSQKTSWTPCPVVPVACSWHLAGRWTARQPGTTTVGQKAGTWRNRQGHETLCTGWILGIDQGFWVSFADEKMRRRDIRDNHLGNLGSWGENGHCLGRMIHRHARQPFGCCYRPFSMSC